MADIINDIAAKISGQENETNYERELKKYESMGFNHYQMCEIRIGLEKGLDVSSYAKPEFNDNQMEEIRLGLEHCIDVSTYAKPELNGDEMYEKRKRLERERKASEEIKREIEVNRLQYTGDNHEELKRFCGPYLGYVASVVPTIFSKPNYEGKEQQMSKGDWVVKYQIQSLK